MCLFMDEEVWISKISPTLFAQAGVGSSGGSCCVEAGWTFPQKMGPPFEAAFCVTSNVTMFSSGVSSVKGVSDVAVRDFKQ